MAKQHTSNQESLRKRVYNFYLDNKHLGKSYTVKHLKAEKVPRTTIYSIIDRAEKEKGPKRVTGSGRRAKKMTKSNLTKLKVFF